MPVLHEEGSELSPPITHPPSNLKLGADEIHIWLGFLDRSSPEQERFLLTLSFDEHARAERFHFQEDRIRYIARHGILRSLLGGYLGVEAGEIRLHYGEHGKPAISGTSSQENINFNLSHSGGVALFAFSRSYLIGVDIEKIRHLSGMEQIVERYFSAGEKTLLRALPPNMRREAFFDCWTRKEAYIKATGEGLSRPLDEFEVMAVLSEGHANVRVIEKKPAGVMSAWTVHRLNLGREYAGSLATNGENSTPRMFQIDDTEAFFNGRPPIL